jgi:hypothetical protein
MKTLAPGIPILLNCPTSAVIEVAVGPATE